MTENNDPEGTPSKWENRPRIVSGGGDLASGQKYAAALLIVGLLVFGVGTLVLLTTRNVFGGVSGVAGGALMAGGMSFIAGYLVVKAVNR